MLVRNKSEHGVKLDGTAKVEKRADDNVFKNGHRKLTITDL